MGKCMSDYVDHLMVAGTLSKTEFLELLKYRNRETMEYAYKQAQITRTKVKRDVVELWGRICFSNYCKQNCKICGMQRNNQFTRRYRMSIKEILEYCENYHNEGIDAFLLESGDDVYYTELKMAEIILNIKKKYPRCRIILSIGDKNKKYYEHMKSIGVTGCFINYGTSDMLYFKKILPGNMSPLLKKQTMWNVKQLGFRTGTEIVIGMPYQTIEHVVEDLLFFKEFVPDIISVSAFVPAPQTPFMDQRSGNGEMAEYLIAVLRIMFPSAYIVATTSLDCVQKRGRIKSLDAGSDVMLVDVGNEARINSYGNFPRKSGRLFLPVDSPKEIGLEIKSRGLTM